MTNIFAIGLTSRPLLPAGPAPGAPMVLVVGVGVVRRRVAEEELLLVRRGELDEGVYGEEVGLERATEEGRGN